MIDNVVIVAGGKNSRFKEMSIFPKLLLPINAKESILTHDTSIFHDKQIYVLINQDYYDMVCDYVANLNLNVKVVKSTNTNGSFGSIYAAKDKLPAFSTLYVWSDLILSREDVDNFEKRVESEKPDYAFGTYALDYRLGVDENGKLDSGRHNLPGIYYTFNFPTHPKTNESGETDLAEVIAACDGDKKAFEWTGPISEFRDKKTFLDYYRSPAQYAPTPRFFNQISVSGSTVIKKCVNHAYDDLLMNENTWYEAINNAGIADIAPKVYRYSRKDGLIEMEYIDGEPVYKAMSCVNYLDIMEKIEQNLAKLHAVKSSTIRKEDFVAAARTELVDKPIFRCNKIKHMLISYDEKELYSLILKAWDWLSNHLDMVPCLCHGDLNMENMLYTKDGEVKFLDPRGYFGNLTAYGSKDYDNAKVLYGLSGYDKFNNENYIYYSQGVYDKPEDRTWIAPTDLNTKMNRIIVATIWISLTSYIGQDIYKANIAMEHGLALLKAALAEKD